MAEAASVGGAVTLIALVTMAIFTIWFGNFMLRTVDILYKPKIKKWIQTRPLDLENLVPTKQDIDGIELSTDFFNIFYRFLKGVYIYRYCNIDPKEGL